MIHHARLSLQMKLKLSRFNDGRYTLTKIDAYIDYSYNLSMHKAEAPPPPTE